MTRDGTVKIFVLQFVNVVETFYYVMIGRITPTFINIAINVVRRCMRNERREITFTIIEVEFIASPRKSPKIRYSTVLSRVRF